MYYKNQISCFQRYLSAVKAADSWACGNRPVCTHFTVHVLFILAGPTNKLEKSPVLEAEWSFLAQDIEWFINFLQNLMCPASCSGAHKNHPQALTVSLLVQIFLI